MAGAGAVIYHRRGLARRAEEARLNTGLYTSSADAGITEKLRSQQELSRERARQNAMLKAIRLGKFGQRSLLSGSFAGIVDEMSAAAALGGTRPGASAGAAPAGGGSASSGIGGGRSSGGGTTRRGRYRSLIA